MYLLNLEQFDEPLSIEVDGEIYKIPKSKILWLLFTQHKQSVYFKGQKFNLGVPADREGYPPLKNISITLENDILARLSLSSQAMKPTIIHQVYRDKQGKRLIKPHITYLPVMDDPNAELRYTVLSQEIDLKKVDAAAIKSKKIPGSIGIGSFGVTFPVTVNLEVGEDDVIFENHKARALKVVLPDPDIEKEAYCLLLTRHLHGKCLVRDKKGRIYLLQKKGGKNLSDIVLEDQPESSSFLSINQRYQYSINFLKSVKHIHDRGVVSRDIKPDNAILDPTNPDEILGIDFGLAKAMLSQNVLYGGTAFFVAPEVLKNSNSPVDESADVFSSGMSVAQFWRGDVQGNAEEIMVHRATKNAENLVRLFIDIEAYDGSDPNLTITAEEQTQIQAIISSLLIYDPKDRDFLDHAIIEFQRSYFEYQVRKGAITQAQKDAAVAALKISQEYVEKLKAIAQPEEYIYERFIELLDMAKEASVNPNLIRLAEPVKKSFDDLDKIFSEYEGQDKPVTPLMQNSLEATIKAMRVYKRQLEEAMKIPSNPTEQLRIVLLEAINKIADDPIAIKTFMQEVGIKCLTEIASKGAVIDRINQIIDESQSNVSLLNKIDTRFWDSNRKRLHVAFQKKMAGKKITIDQLVSNNNEMSAYIKQSQQENFTTLMNRVLTMCERAESNLTKLGQFGGLPTDVDNLRQAIQNNLTALDNLLIACRDRSVEFNQMSATDFDKFISQQYQAVQTIENELGENIQQLKASSALKRVKKQFMLDKCAPVANHLCAISEKIEIHLHILKQSDKLPAALSSVKRTLKDMLRSDIFESFKSVDLDKMSMAEFETFLNKSNYTIKLFEEKVDSFIQHLKALPEPAVSDEEKKQSLLISLQCKINDAASLDDIRTLYAQMQDGPYRFLKKERGWFRFHREGTTRSWGQAVACMQKKAYQLLSANDFGVSEDENRLLENLFAEKQNRKDTKRVYFENFREMRYVLPRLQS